MEYGISNEDKRILREVAEKYGPERKMVQAQCTSGGDTHGGTGVMGI